MIVMSLEAKREERSISKPDHPDLLISLAILNVDVLALCFSDLTAEISALCFFFGWPRLRFTLDQEFRCGPCFSPATRHSGFSLESAQ